VCGRLSQGLPQPPQFLLSVVVSTHAPAHSMRGGTQAKSQSPRAQTGVALLGAMHTTSQSPQCAVLVSKSTQEPSQSVVVPTQVEPHWPAVQTCCVPHFVGHAPQCVLSDFKSTHSPSQFVYPKLQAMSQPFGPHTAVPLGFDGHVTPQARQLLVSSSRTQAPSQRL
jgi:hypothetical protein